MNKILKLDPIQPRFLRYRGHYKFYILGFGVISFLLFNFWGLRFWENGFFKTLSEESLELTFTGMYFAISGAFYYFWLKAKMQKSVQVYEDHILIHDGKNQEVLRYSEIQSVNMVCWSIFYVKMVNGYKHYFNSGLERIDYVWEGIYANRPDLISKEQFEEFRVKLIQFDHHQRRKDWFFKHRLIDVFNWSVLPLMFLMLAYFFQSRHIEIHQQGLYFFRLFMFALLVLLSTAFLYSITLKKLIFDKKIIEKLENSEDKSRDLEFEGVILQRSKIFQLITATFVLALIVKMDINLYSVSKVKEDIAHFNLKKGYTIVIDNRFNCTKNCRYQLHDGDLIIFGKGGIGQVLAKEGDMVGQVAQDDKGRMIASENVQEVPKGQVAVKTSNGKDIVFVKIEDLIGKIQK